MGYLALLGRPGGLPELACGSNKASRLPPAHLRCSAPLKGARKASRLDWQPVIWPVAVDPEKRAKIKISTFAPALIVATPVSTPDGLPGPLGGAEQRRNAGGSRRALFEGRSPELRSRPAFRVAQGTGAAGTDPGSPSSLLTFFLATQEESKTPVNGGKEPLRKTPHASGAEPSASELPLAPTNLGHIKSSKTRHR